LFCLERIAPALAHRNQALQSARKARSRFTLLASAWPHGRRYYRRRVLSEQLDRGNADSAFRAARNPAPATRARSVGSVTACFALINTASLARCYSPD